jgi:hypothetical protein
MREQNTDLGKCTCSIANANQRYEDVGDMKRAIHHYEKGVSQADSASLYVVLIVSPLIIENGYAPTSRTERISGQYPRRN